ncbi:MAG: chemotaxis response regulator protein-glutamate methylesterase [Proteobacteria bacterium SG_bin7]|nr:MAG: chemotaxis response regulator protein-glutamate methylesterase [Proteobacteria bacterium SG_bin7]
MNQKIRVLVVDDSSIIRTLLTKFLSSDPEIEVVGSAPDPYVAREMLTKLKPDVMTLDVEMPKMDGVTFLEKVMQHLPTRTLIISSLSTQGSATTLRAFEVGAIDVMAKPAIDVTRSMEAVRYEIITRVKVVAKSNLPEKRTLSPIVRARPTDVKATALAKTTHSVLAIASSTGGTEALKRVLPLLPPDIPGTVIVQHLPPVFTKTYADNLQKLCQFEVKEAQDGDKVFPGRALIAPGNFHMELSRSGAYYFVKLHQEPALHGVRPAADYLMKSVSKYAGANAIGVVLTGMGKDGAEGLLAMKEAGSYNIAQNEQSCVVFGMPKVAIDVGAVHEILPLDRIAAEIIKRCQMLAVA